MVQGMVPGVIRWGLGWGWRESIHARSPLRHWHCRVDASCSSGTRHPPSRSYHRSQPSMDRAPPVVAPMLRDLLRNVAPKRTPPPGHSCQRRCIGLRLDTAEGVLAPSTLSIPSVALLVRCRGPRACRQAAFHRPSRPSRPLLQSYDAHTRVFYTTGVIAHLQWSAAAPDEPPAVDSS